MDPQLIFASAEWIERLARELKRIRDERQAQLTALGDTFGDPRGLADCYVEPDVQHMNPADYDEDREPEEGGLAYVRTPAFTALNRFLRGSGHLRDGRNQLFLLSDAGMGKTSLLLMLRLTHLTRFWPAGYGCTLLKLGSDTVQQIRDLPDKGNTVLLLDALDEDPGAWGRIGARVEELLQQTTQFRRVIISCRTQFFPEGNLDPFGRPGRIEIGGYLCPMLFLSLFDDGQVERYLRRRYPDHLGQWLLARSNPVRVRAEAVVHRLRSLRFRPLLLARMDDILGVGDLLPAAAGRDPADGDRDWTAYRLYDALVNGWLAREEAKLRRHRGNPPTRQTLLDVCTLLAVQLQARGERHLPAEQLDALVAAHPQIARLRELDVGGRSLLNRNADGAFRFSHYSIQEFLVVRALAEGALDLGTGELRLQSDPSAAAAGPPILVQPPGTRLRLTDQMVDFIADAGLVLDEQTFDLSDIRAEGRAGLAIRTRLPDGTPTPVLQYIPAGSFQMGSGRLERGGIARERPQHPVDIAAGFWLGRYPVTFDEYDAFCAATGREPPDNKGWGRGSRPVINVSWEDAAAYCAWLTEQTGETWRLPTEAEWEDACRAGSRTRFSFGDSDDDLGEHAWYEDNAGGKTHPVGEKRPNRWGLYDMHGNVWEWVQDRWHDSYDRAPADGSAWESSESGAARVIRGGSWLGDARYCRSAVRGRPVPDSRNVILGFRCARVQS